MDVLSDIKTDHLILARRPDLIIINKKKRTYSIVDFAVSADHRIELKESEKKDKYLDLGMELKKTVEHGSDNDMNRVWSFWYSHRRIIKDIGGLGNEWRPSKLLHY